MLEPEEAERQRLLNSELAKDLKLALWKEQLLGEKVDFPHLIRVAKLLYVADAKKDIKLLLPDLKDIQIECEQDGDKHGTFTYVDRYVLHFNNNECLILAKDADTFLNDVADDHIHLVNMLNLQPHIDTEAEDPGFTEDTEKAIERFYNLLDMLTELYNLDPSGHVYSF
jgi:hypothetical protein